MRNVATSAAVLAAVFLLGTQAGAFKMLAEHPLIQATDARSTSDNAAPVLLTAAQVEGLLPPTVFFRGKSASVQMRNAAGARFGTDSYLLAALVDTSGYASSVQETYQAYLITERALTIGGKAVAPGAYGFGMVNGRFLLMDIGGHTLLEAATTSDAVIPRPRPLLLTKSGDGLRLYLGRNWIAVSAATP